MRKRSWQEVLRGVIKMATKVLKYLAPFGDFFFFSFLYFFPRTYLLMKVTLQRYQFCTVKHWACQLAKHSQRLDLAAALTQSSWLPVGTNGLFSSQTC